MGRQFPVLLETRARQYVFFSSQSTFPAFNDELDTSKLSKAVFVRHLEADKKSEHIRKNDSPALNNKVVRKIIDTIDRYTLSHPPVRERKRRLLSKS